MSKKEQVIQELNRVISLIHTDIQAISPAEKKQMVEETVEHFNHYVSPGWLAYRKSVSSDSEAATAMASMGNSLLTAWAASASTPAATETRRFWTW
mgnify:CR=1 FL=1